MPDPERGTDRAGRRAKRFLSPLQKYEIFRAAEHAAGDEVSRFVGERRPYRAHHPAVGELVSCRIGLVAVDVELAREASGAASVELLEERRPVEARPFELLEAGLVEGAEGRHAAGGRAAASEVDEAGRPEVAGRQRLALRVH